MSYSSKITRHHVTWCCWTNHKDKMSHTTFLSPCSLQPLISLLEVLAEYFQPFLYIWTENFKLSTKFIHKMCCCNFFGHLINNKYVQTFYAKPTRLVLTVKYFFQFKITSPLLFCTTFKMAVPKHAPKRGAHNYWRRELTNLSRVFRRRLPSNEA